MAAPEAKDIVNNQGDKGAADAKPKPGVQAGGPGPDAELQSQRFVEAVYTDTDKNEVALVFVGFLGRAPAEDNKRWRLYFTLQLKEYVEFREKDVIDFKWLGTPFNPLGGYVVWLKTDALLYFKPANIQEQATFLAGNITAGLLPQMGSFNLFRERRRDPAVAGDSDLGCSNLPICWG
jgi:hypothetical protein